MTVWAYSKIPLDAPVFDGRKAWQKISSLGFQVTKARDCPVAIQKQFRSWLVLHEATIRADFDEAEILIKPAA